MSAPVTPTGREEARDGVALLRDVLDLTRYAEPDVDVDPRFTVGDLRQIAAALERARADAERAQQVRQLLRDAGHFDTDIDAACEGCRTAALLAARALGAEPGGTDG